MIHGYGIVTSGDAIHGRFDQADYYLMTRQASS